MYLNPNFANSLKITEIRLILSKKNASVPLTDVYTQVHLPISQKSKENFVRIKKEIFNFCIRKKMNELYLP